MKIKKIIILCIIVLIIIAIYTINNIKIFSITSLTAQEVYDDLIQSRYVNQDIDMFVLNYRCGNFHVEKSTVDYYNELGSLKDVCLKSICNPRHLKLNTNSYLDDGAKYVVITQKVDKMLPRSEKYNKAILNAKEIIITDVYIHDNEIHKVKFSELSFGGKVNAFFALFVPFFRYHI